MTTAKCLDLCSVHSILPELQLTNWLNYSIGENAQHFGGVDMDKGRGRGQRPGCRRGSERDWVWRAYY